MARFARFFRPKIDRGIYLPYSQLEATFLSAMHTEKHIDQTITAVREALTEIVCSCRPPLVQRMDDQGLTRST